MTEGRAGRETTAARSAAGNDFLIVIRMRDGIIAPKEKHGITPTGNC